MALDRISASLSLPLTAVQIVLHLLLTQTLKFDPRHYQSLANVTIRRKYRDATKDAMGAPREELQTSPRRRFILSFWKNTASDSNDRIGTNNPSFAFLPSYLACFNKRQPSGMLAGQFSS